MAESLMLRFKSNFLIESPIRISAGHSDACQMLSNDIEKFLLTGNYQKVRVTDDCFKLELTDTIYYWFEDQNKIVLICELEKNSLAWMVRLIGKDKNYAHKPPYAYELLELILADSHESIRVVSDQSMTDNGYQNWLRLFDNGYKISVYDKNNPGQSFEPFQSKEEMESYFQKGSQYRNYQFILSESKKQCDIISIFTLRRWRELTNMEHEDF